MGINYKKYINFLFRGKESKFTNTKKTKAYITALFSVLLILISGLSFLFEIKPKVAEAEPILNNNNYKELSDFIILQQNSLLSLNAPIINEDSKEKKKMFVIATAYSSTPWETDSDPYTTASGNLVRDGIVANNFLSFGTKIRIPEFFGDKIFVVEDRMNWRKGNNYIDIWFPSHQEALNFGAKKTYIEILEN